jgi:hypothetical protein
MLKSSIIGLLLSSLVAFSPDVAGAVCRFDTNINATVPSGTTDAVITSFGVFVFSGTTVWRLVNGVWQRFADDATSLAKGTDDGLLYIGFANNQVNQYNASGLSAVIYGLTARSLGVEDLGHIYASSQFDRYQISTYLSNTWVDLSSDPQARGEVVRAVNGRPMALSVYSRQVAIRIGLGDEMDYICAGSGWTCTSTIPNVYSFGVGRHSVSRSTMVIYRDSSSNYLNSWQEVTSSNTGIVTGRFFYSPYAISKVVEGNDVWGAFLAYDSGNKVYRLLAYTCSEV